MNQGRDTSNTRLVFAVRNGDWQAIRRELASGGNLKWADAEGRGLMHEAAISGRPDAVSLMLDLGVSPSAPDRDGRTPLHFAALGQHDEVAERLLAAGAPVDAMDNHGNTALASAVYESRGRGQTITVLLSRGADPDAANRHGVTPRQLARTIANYDVAQFFPRPVDGADGP